MKRYIAIGSIFLIQALLIVSCSKTVVFKQADQKVRPLKTKARIIRLHEDFLFAEREASALKRLVMDKIEQAMNRQTRYQFEFIPSGKDVPRNDSTKESIFLIGDIWMLKGETSGRQVVKVSRFQNGMGYSESWDDIEMRNWEQTALQTVISLYFVEIGNDTRILRATITVSNDKKQEVNVGGRNIFNKQASQFSQDKKLQAGYDLIETHVDVTSLDRALEDLATQAVAVHFDTLY